MKVTGISAQLKNRNRVNIIVEGSYRFSLDIYQIADLGIRVGNEYSETELIELETESQFGKLYSRALEYCLMRPHSAREVRDYLWRKTRSRKVKRKDGTIVDQAGVAQDIADRVYDRLLEKNYIDDEKFAKFWVENRNQTKGSSIRKLVNELCLKGVASAHIESALATIERNDQLELQKIITKKRSKYPDEQKFMQYLARQGFRYDDIKIALAVEV